MKNADFIQSFSNGKRYGKNMNTSIRDGVFFSYEKPIATIRDNTVFINNDKYSKTSTVHKNMIIRATSRFDMNIVDETFFNKG